MLCVLRLQDKIIKMMKDARSPHSTCSTGEFGTKLKIKIVFWILEKYYLPAASQQFLLIAIVTRDLYIWVLRFLA